MGYYFRKNMGFAPNTIPFSQGVVSKRAQSDMRRSARGVRGSSYGLNVHTAARKVQITQSVFGNGTKRSTG